MHASFNISGCLIFQRRWRGCMCVRGLDMYVDVRFDDS